VARNGRIRIKKEFGQHFLRDDAVAREAVGSVRLNGACVIEIGPGDGFLTRHILSEPVARLYAYEIDREWAGALAKEIKDDRLDVICADFLEVDLEQLAPQAPLTVVSNLPYHVTFPILRKLQRNRHLLREGVVMMQEEVAQKIVGTRGRGYGAVSLFFQRFFTWRLLTKVPPSAFLPPPKVFSRLLHFVPRQDIEPIEHEQNFWKFVKAAFHQPRRTLRNNLLQTHYALDQISDELLAMRAQQLGMEDFLALWRLLSHDRRL